MSGTGETREVFAGEPRGFRIRLGEIRRIEAKCGAGVGEILRRLSRAVYVTRQLKGIEALAAGIEIHADDVRETLYQGLIGHGMPAPEAGKLIGAEIDERGVRGILDHVGTALAVLWGSQEVPDTGEPQAGPGSAPEIPPSR